MAIGGLGCSDSAASSDGDRPDDGAVGAVTLVELIEVAELGDPSAVARELRDDQLDRLALLAACVSDGEVAFDSAEVARSLPPLEDPIFNTDAWASEYGLGISTTWFTQAEVGPGLLGGQEDPEAVALDLYLDSLPEDERQGVTRAVYGDEGSDGCLAEVAESGGTLRGRQAALLASIEQLWSWIEADPAHVAALRDASACLSGHGYKVTTLSAARSDLSDRLATIVESSGPPEPDSGIAGAQVLDASSARALAELQDYEAGLGTALVGCGVGPEALITLIRSEILPRYLEEFNAHVAETG